MQTTEVDYLDGKFTIQESEPNNLAEMQELGFTEADVVGGAVDDLRYRNKYPRVYKKVSADLASKHNFARQKVDSKTKKDGTVVDVLESVNDHIRAALVGRKVKDADGKDTETVVPNSALADGENILSGLFQSYAASEPLYVKGERSGLGGKVSEAALTAANGFFAEGPTKVEAVADYIEGKVPGYKVGRDADGEITPESLARGVSALQKKIAKDAADSAKAALGALGV